MQKTLPYLSAGPLPSEEREEGGGEGERHPFSEEAEEEEGMGSDTGGREEPEERDLQHPI